MFGRLLVTLCHGDDNDPDRVAGAVCAGVFGADGCCAGHLLCAGEGIRETDAKLGGAGVLYGADVADAVCDAGGDDAALSVLVEGVLKA